MKTLAVVLIALAALSAAIGCRGPWSGSHHGYLAVPASQRTKATTPLAGSPSRRFNSHVVSWRQLNRQNVVMQQHDYSCGAAALATLMRYYFEDDVTEKDILDDILEKLSPEDYKEREEHGLSLNDLFKTARDMGYLAAAVKLPVEKIKELQAPVIVRIEPDGYKHFVVLRGSYEDRVLLADPTRGNIRVPVFEFLEQWSGEALVLGKRGFGLPKDYPLAIDRDRPLRNEEAAARRSLYLRP